MLPDRSPVAAPHGGDDVTTKDQIRGVVCCVPPACGYVRTFGLSRWRLACSRVRVFGLPRPGLSSENPDCVVVGGPGHLQRAGDLLHVHAEREQGADAQRVRRQGLVKQQFAGQTHVGTALRLPWRPRVARHEDGYAPADQFIRAAAVAVPDRPFALNLDGKLRAVGAVLLDGAPCAESRRLGPPVQRRSPVIADAVRSIPSGDAAPRHRTNCLSARSVPTGAYVMLCSRSLHGEGGGRSAVENWPASRRHRRMGLTC